MPVDVANEGLSGCRVLIVEDRYLVADDLSRLLARNGAEIVAVVGDVARASELAATGKLDLAVLDVDLRGQDVFDVAAILEGRAIPFLFVTGFPRAHLPEILGGRYPLFDALDYDALPETVASLFTGA